MLQLGLRDPGNLKKMDIHKYSFQNLAFMLNFGSKSKNETFLLSRICEFTETWVVTQRDVEGHIKSH